LSISQQRVSPIRLLFHDFFLARRSFWSVFGLLAVGNVSLSRFWIERAMTVRTLSHVASRSCGCKRGSAVNWHINAAIYTRISILGFFTAILLCKSLFYLRSSSQILIKLLIWLAYLANVILRIVEVLFSFINEGIDWLVHDWVVNCIHLKRFFKVLEVFCWIVDVRGLLGSINESRLFFIIFIIFLVVLILFIIILVKYFSWNWFYNYRLFFFKSQFRFYNNFFLFLLLYNNWIYHRSFMPSLKLFHRFSCLAGLKMYF